MIAEIKKKYKVNFPDYVWKSLIEKARQEARLRMTLNAENGSYVKGTEGYRENDEEIQFYGCLGELIHMFHYNQMVEQGIIKEEHKPIFYPAVDTQPVNGVDALINHTKRDVKCNNKYWTSSDTGFKGRQKKIQVNCKSHQNISKTADEYHFVKADATAYEADIYVVPTKQVGNWEKKIGHTPYYEAEIPEGLLYDEDKENKEK